MMFLFLKKYSFVKEYFCTNYNEEYAMDLVGCKLNVARDVLYLIAAVLVLVELGFGFRVDELGRQKV